MDNPVINMANTINNRKARERREAEENAHKRYMAGRRRDARARGYRGPLTRDEAARIALSQL